MTVLSTLARLGVSVALLFLLARVLDVGEVASRLTELSAPWVLLGLGLSVAQVVGLAWRWRFTAARLGIDLPLRAAISEYYLGILLNQVVPGGVAGDVSRAWRHARASDETGSAVRAVVLERASSQAIMTSVALLSLFALPQLSAVVGGLAVLLVLVGSAAVYVVWTRRASAGPRTKRIAGDVHEALFAREALPIQFVTGLIAVGSYIAMYVIAARAVAVDTDLATLLPLIAPVLMAMLVPVTVAGWGVREGAAATLWGWVGLSPEDGVAISLAYGLLVLASSAPGLLVLMRFAIAGRDRTAHRPRDGSDDTRGGAPHRGSPPAAR